MTTLNRAAAEAIARLAGRAVHACTDITGFGLIGHASEMAAASGCSLRIHADRVPIIDGARALVRGNMPGGGRTNREHFGRRRDRRGRCRARPVDLLYDPQTSGGLLLALRSGPGGCDCCRARAAGVLARRDRRAASRGGSPIRVV